LCDRGNVYYSMVRNLVYLLMVAFSSFAENNTLKQSTDVKLNYTVLYNFLRKEYGCQNTYQNRYPNNTGYHVGCKDIDLQVDYMDKDDTSPAFIKVAVMHSNSSSVSLATSLLSTAFNEPYASELNNKVLKLIKSSKQINTTIDIHSTPVNILLNKNMFSISVEWN